nr:glycine-rich protein 1-like [Aegilops tauschii subsp. strangulata]XP_040255149.1 glycine-rich protein 1-like [Aegilops tauschii subsp. strangulata]
MDEAAGAHDAGQEGRRRPAGGAGVEVVAGLAGAGAHAATNDGGREHAGGGVAPGGAASGGAGRGRRGAEQRSWAAPRGAPSSAAASRSSGDGDSRSGDRGGARGMAPSGVRGCRTASCGAVARPREEEMAGTRRTEARGYGAPAGAGRGVR